MKRHDILSQKVVLRDLVLKNGGRMLKSAIRNNHSFEGWEWSQVYPLVFALREELFGADGPYGIECWEIFKDEVVGLESKLTIREREKLNDRRHIRQVGSGNRTIPQNLLWRGRIKRELVDGATKVKALDKSTRDLGLVIKSSSKVAATPIEQPEGQAEKHK